MAIVGGLEGHGGAGIDRQDRRVRRSKARGPAGRLVLLLDDTLTNKNGRKVDGAGFFHDAVTSTAVTHKVAAWGLNVVVLALRVPSPWGGEPLALPVMVRLRRKSKEGATDPVDNRRFAGVKTGEVG